MKGNWLLPESLADTLPAEARRIEELRRQLLDLFRTYGFELVAPPLVEYIDSLLSGTGSDLNLRTSKLVDQLSGRTLGVRADMTPQITRIDAHLLNRAGVTRLCYCGPVLHARPAGLLSSRELLQIGAEIFGHKGFEADLEIIRLALESARLAGVQALRLDLCHAGLVRSLIEADAAALLAIARGQQLDLDVGLERIASDSSPTAARAASAGGGGVSELLPHGGGVSEIGVERRVERLAHVVPDGEDGSVDERKALEMRARRHGLRERLLPHSADAHWIDELDAIRGDVTTWVEAAREAKRVDDLDTHGIDGQHEEYLVRRIASVAEEAH